VEAPCRPPVVLTGLSVSGLDVVIGLIFYVYFVPYYFWYTGPCLVLFR